MTTCNNGNKEVKGEKKDADMIKGQGSQPKRAPWAKAGAIFFLMMVLDYKPNNKKMPMNTSWCKWIYE